jgi:hypothetical protein
MNQKTNFAVIGLNKTGRTLALMLGITKTGTITLIDEDKVNESNYPQGYSEVDLGMLKTEAVKLSILETINPKTSDVNIMVVNNINSAIEELENRISNTVVFCCKPISNKTKQHILRAVEGSCRGVYFCCYDNNGDYEVHQFGFGDEGYGSGVMEQFGSAKENTNKAADAASEMFAFCTNTLNEQ